MNMAAVQPASTAVQFAMFTTSPFPNSTPLPSPPPPPPPASHAFGVLVTGASPLRVVPEQLHIPAAREEAGAVVRGGEVAGLVVSDVTSLVPGLHQDHPLDVMPGSERKASTHAHGGQLGRGIPCISSMFWDRRRGSFGPVATLQSGRIVNVRQFLTGSAVRQLQEAMHCLAHQGVYLTALHSRLTFPGPVLLMPL